MREREERDGFGLYYFNMLYRKIKKKTRMLDIVEAYFGEAQ